MTDSDLRQLFHDLWGQSKDGIYDKPKWQELQRELNRRKVLAGARNSKMKPEIKTIWIEALESGEYLQGHGQLREDNTYCCLGVLCDLYRRETGKGAWGMRGTGNGTFTTESGDVAYANLPKAVSDWGGVDEDDQEMLITHNDPYADYTGKTPVTLDPEPFPRIADLIRTFL